jgi:hypothetical protein
MTLLLVLLGSALVFVVLIALSARTMFRQMSLAWDTPHEYVQVEALPRVPTQGYERLQAELEKLGFRHTARLENLAMTKAYPQLRTYLDVYLVETGDVHAATFWASIPPNGQQVLDFDSTFDDQTTLTTTNSPAAGLLGPAPHVERHILKDVEAVETLLARHREFLERNLASGKKRVRPVRTLVELESALAVHARLECEHRRSIGYLTYEEVKAMGGGQLFLPGSLRLLYWFFTRYAQRHRRRSSSS